MKQFKAPWKDLKVKAIKIKSGKTDVVKLFYQSHRWRKFRKALLSDYPYCSECLKEGKEIQAVFIKHIIPINQAGDPWDANNLKPLCCKHHNTSRRKTKL